MTIFSYIINYKIVIIIYKTFLEYNIEKASFTLKLINSTSLPKQAKQSCIVRMLILCLFFNNSLISNDILLASKLCTMFGTIPSFCFLRFILSLIGVLLVIDFLLPYILEVNSFSIVNTYLCSIINPPGVNQIGFKFNFLSCLFISLK